MDWNENDDNTYILEIEFDYPKRRYTTNSQIIHYFPKTWRLNNNILSKSKHQRDLYIHYNNGKETRDEKQPKLILNQQFKTNYVVHIKFYSFV